MWLEPNTHLTWSNFPKVRCGKVWQGVARNQTSLLVNDSSLADWIRSSMTVWTFPWIRCVCFTTKVNDVFLLLIWCRSMLLILWTEKGSKMPDKNSRSHILYYLCHYRTSGRLKLCWFIGWECEILLTSNPWPLSEHYQGPFDGKQHNLGISKQTGLGKLNRPLLHNRLAVHDLIWMGCHTCLFFWDCLPAGSTLYTSKQKNFPPACLVWYQI